MSKGHNLASVGGVIELSLGIIDNTFFIMIIQQVPCTQLLQIPVS